MIYHILYIMWFIYYIYITHHHLRKIAGNASIWCHENWRAFGTPLLGVQGIAPPARCSDWNDAINCCLNPHGCKKNLPFPFILGTNDSWRSSFFRKWIRFGYNVYTFPTEDQNVGCLNLHSAGTTCSFDPSPGSPGSPDLSWAINPMAMGHRYQGTNKVTTLDCVGLNPSSFRGRHCWAPVPVLPRKSSNPSSSSLFWGLCWIKPQGFLWKLVTPCQLYILCIKIRDVGWYTPLYHYWYPIKSPFCIAKYYLAGYIISYIYMYIYIYIYIWVYVNIYISGYIPLYPHYLPIILNHLASHKAKQDTKTFRPEPSNRLGRVAAQQKPRPCRSLKAWKFNGFNGKI